MTTTKSGLWYIAVEGSQPAGPFTTEQIMESWQAGRLDEQTLCRQQGADQWVRLADVEPLASMMLRAKKDPSPIHFVCACGKQIAMDRKFAGRKVKCKQCGTVVRLPAAEDTGDAPPVSAAPRSAPGNTAGSGPRRQVGSPVQPPADGRKGQPSHASRDSDSTASVARPAHSDILPEITPLQQILAELGKGEASGKEVASRKVGTGDIYRNGSDAKAVSAGHKPIVEHSCHVCGTRIEQKQKRCTNCLAPLTAEEIAADAATRRKPLLPWLPRFHLSSRAGGHIIAACVLVTAGLFYGFWLHPALRNKAIVQAHVDLAGAHLSTTTDPQSPMKLLRLTCEPGLLYHRPAEVKVSGKLEIPQGGAAVIAAGDGTLSLTNRKLTLKVALDGRSYTYEASLPPPLHLAALYGDARRLELLLSDPAVDVNEADEHGSTALHLAAGIPGDHLRRVRMLLEHKANGAIRDEKNLTPLLTARAVQNGWCAFELDPRPPHAKPAPPRDEPPQD